MICLAFQDSFTRRYSDEYFGQWLPLLILSLNLKPSYALRLELVVVCCLAIVQPGKGVVFLCQLNKVDIFFDRTMLEAALGICCDNSGLSVFDADLVLTLDGYFNIGNRRMDLTFDKHAFNHLEVHAYI